MSTPQSPGLDAFAHLVRDDVSATFAGDAMRRIVDPRLKQETEIVALICAALLLLVYGLSLAALA